MSSTADLTAAELDRYADLLAEAKSIKGVSLGKDAWRRLRKSYAAMTSLGFLIAIGLLALMTPLLPLQSPVQQDLSNRQFLAPNTGPMSLDLVELLDKPTDDDGDSAYDDRVKTLFNNPNAFDRMQIRVRLAIFGDWCVPSICGTDNLGQDIFARLFWGARVSLIVGIVATLVSLAIGVSYGAIAGYFGGRVDNVMMRIVDVLYSIPFIFVVIFLMTFLNAPEIKATMREYNIDQIMVFYLVIGAIYWLTMSRVVRGQVISIKNEQFVEAARTIGATRLRIIFRHLVPNLLSIVIVYLSLTIPAVMLFEAFLSFLGLGVSPPDVSWGLLANDGLKVITPIKIYWWLVLFPGLALALTLFALNFLGDGLRDALDPRMKNR